MFKDSWVPISCSGTWSGSVGKVHIASQEFQAVQWMLYEMKFWLSNKVVDLNVDSSTAKACLCDFGLYSFSLFLISMLHMESGWQTWY